MNKLIVEAIKQSKGQFFTVKFTKRDGTIRVMNCRTGVKKYINHPLKGLTYEAKDLFTKDWITVYDIQKKGYRSFYPESVLALNIRNFKFALD